MPSYALLLLPSANRVYTAAAAELTQAELAVCNDTVLGGRLRHIRPDAVAGVPYLCFEADELSADHVAYLANTSAAYALFEREQREEPLLRPVPLQRLDQFDDDLVTIQKYPGKTNEQFTKLLLNVTLLASASAPDLLQRRLRVLDPLCGRGTTLNQALTYGYHAAGMELDGKDFEAYATFIQTYLKRKRIKHQAQVVPVRRDKRLVARWLSVSLSPSKESYRAGDTLSLDVVHADTTAAGDFFKPASFDVIVTDAPYGVQHGSRSAASGLRRSPLDLLAAAVPAWSQLLRPGGALGISWNTLVAKRADLVAILADAGLQVLDEPPYTGFRHRVDQAITRDILIARR